MFLSRLLSLQSKPSLVFIKNKGIQQGLDEIQDLLGKTLLLEIVSAHLDPKTGLEKNRIKGYAHRVSKDGSNVKYEAEFEIPADFGEIGAVVVKTSIIMKCLSRTWCLMVCQMELLASASYLPSETPSGLRKLREHELLNLQGEGKEIVNPSKGFMITTTLTPIQTRNESVLGGKDFPYPRRCRTDVLVAVQKWEAGFYVSRDEAFSEVKQLTFSTNFMHSMLTTIIPWLKATILDPDLGFPTFNAIDELYTQGLNLPALDKKELWNQSSLGLSRTSPTKLTVFCASRRLKHWTATSIAT
ncbi:Detected protein of unknown function [Hibiscus syriacus]|uniref:Lipoxygenase domain-containing protein n=1 Tax=Hibiscus syriacus TaxID=106335 RepID=A0A6A3B3I7_HIBSY|nr:Detected protein of unknown function [Hibiscus syriacus]